MFKQCGEEEVGRTGATTTCQSPAELPVPGKYPSFACSSQKGGGLPFHSACTSPAAPRRSLLQTDTHSIGSLKQSKLCVWRKKGGKKKRSAKQSARWSCRLAAPFGDHKWQLAWRTRTFFFAVRHPLQVRVGNLGLCLVFTQKWLHGKVNGRRIR